MIDRPCNIPWMKQTIRWIILSSLLFQITDSFQSFSTLRSLDVFRFHSSLLRPCPPRRPQLVRHSSNSNSIRLLAQPNSSSPSSSSSARVRFTAFQERVTTSTTTSPIDTVLSILTSDVGSIALGLLGLILLLVGRFFFFDDSGVQNSNNVGYETRVNLLAVFAVGSVLLNGLTKLDVESVVSEPVVLVGQVLPEPMVRYDTVVAARWTLSALLAATPACTAILVSRDDDNLWKLLAAAGVVPTQEAEQLLVPPATPILDRFLKESAQETYLPTLQALPGRTEFTYLPSNTQAVLLLPVPDLGGVLVLGSNQAKSFTPRDIAWCQTITKQLKTL